MWIRFAEKSAKLPENGVSSSRVMAEVAGISGASLDATITMTMVVDDCPWELPDESKNSTLNMKVSEVPTGALGSGV